ncbi:DUF309 domain-containing protein [Paenibacillus senegalensis]|uniref:DUF309 domain-containing protein n=1 Tax=Paenibacillus senegalensis TaxID=1465766 RepID=UPI00028A1291|nr:DUF309 domain-containing protein [Paenibacillus senegalensis]
MRANPKYSPLYLAFLYFFNEERDYYECHEVLEELWMEEARSPLYQGLLQVAVALYHCRNDNWSGSCKLFAQAIDKLERYPSETHGINLDQLVKDCRHYLQELKRIPDGEFRFYDLTIQYTDPELVLFIQQMRQQPPEKLASD